MDDITWLYIFDVALTLALAFLVVCVETKRAVRYAVAVLLVWSLAMAAWLVETNLTK